MGYDSREIVRDSGGNSSFGSWSLSYKTYSVGRFDVGSLGFGELSPHSQTRGPSEGVPDCTRVKRLPHTMIPTSSPPPTGPQGVGPGGPDEHTHDDDDDRRVEDVSTENDNDGYWVPQSYRPTVLVV